jgi:flagellar protein FlaG
MSDLINPVGSQGPSPPVQGGVKSAASGVTVADSEARAIQNAATAAKAARNDQATKLDLSSASGISEQTTSRPMTMEEAAQAFQAYLESLPSDLQFQPDFEANMVVFKVVNPVTQKVIRQLPPEEVVQQARNLRMDQQKNHSGILLDESL